jgi:hypothetical protein
MALGPLFAMPAALLGARIVQQRRGNRLGWILLAMGLTQAIAQTANAYAWLSINRHGGGLVGTTLATWVCSFAWMPNFALGPYLLLLFPNGRLPGRRWRPAAWVGGAVMAVLMAAFAVLAWPVRGTTLYQNTLGEVALAPLDALEGLLYLVGDALIVVAAVALLMRLRRLRGAERQQTKWFAFGAIPWVAVDLAWVTVAFSGGDVPALAAGPGSVQPGGRGGDAGGGWTVPTAAAPRPAGGGPALRPAPLRRGQDHRAVQWPPPRGGGPGHALRRVAAGGRPDDGADHGVAVAATAGWSFLPQSDARWLSIVTVTP